MFSRLRIPSLSSRSSLATQRHARERTLSSRQRHKWARQTNRLRFLGTSLSLYELKVDGKVIRIMTYVHHDATPVYLFDFDEHQGKHAGIPKHVMDRGKKLTAIAAGLIMEEHND